MATTDNAPPVTGELLRWLEGVFPDRLPLGPSIDSAEINMRIGEQRVIRKLRNVHQLQHEQSLSGTP